VLLGLRLAAVPTLVLGAVVVATPDHAETAGRIWLLVVGALVAVAGVAALRNATAGPASLFEQQRAPGTSPPRLPSLERVEREVTLGSASAFDAHVRLRPTLRAVARDLLAARRGIALDASPERARDALGEETWLLVRDGREAPSDPRAPGLDRATLERVVDSMERL
jgi:hypothetical protein